jgi:hypothetical protein
MNLPTGEPRDGDFVAYLEEIERQQMAHLPTHALAALEGAEVHPPGRQSAAGVPKQFKALPAMIVGNIALGVVGLFFLLLGLIGTGGMIAVAIGAFLIWRAAKAVTHDLQHNRQDMHEAPARALQPAGKTR